jgi:hypothetical protein
MTGLEAFLGQSSDRWAHAHKRAQGVEDNGLGDAVRTYYTRYVPAGLLVLLAAGTIAGMLGVAGSPPDWAAFSVFGILLAALEPSVGDWSTTRKVPAARPGRVDVLLALETGERKQRRAGTHSGGSWRLDWAWRCLAWRFSSVTSDGRAGSCAARPMTQCPGALSSAVLLPSVRWRGRPEASVSPGSGLKPLAQ